MKSEKARWIICIRRTLFFHQNSKKQRHRNGICSRSIAYVSSRSLSQPSLSLSSAPEPWLPIHPATPPRAPAPPPERALPSRQSLAQQFMGRVVNASSARLDPPQLQHQLRIRRPKKIPGVFNPSVPRFPIIQSRQWANKTCTLLSGTRMENPFTVSFLFFFNILLF